jgi:dTDP-4-dehydrorhamnose 3,5-epimerase
MEIHTKIQNKIEEIETEMKQIGFWSKDRINIDPTQCREAFCADKLETYDQWLQFVFIPNVRKAISEKSTLPSKSQVGIQAMREFEGMEDADELVRLLNDFDRIVQSA